MSFQIQLRRGTAAQWTSANTILAQGEVGYETDANKIKIGDGVTAWTTLPYFTGTAAITALTGDVSATGPGSVAATVNSVGGSSAANVHSAELAANAATNLNTASTTVKRDASGNFSAGTITAALSGNASTATSATSFSGSLAGDVTGPQGTTVVASVGTSSAANIHTAEQLVNGVEADHKVLAGPITGPDAAPTFRVLDPTDIPSLSYEPPITSGSSSQYWKGDKSFQTLEVSALTDASSVSPAVGQALIYNGTKYTNQDINTVSAGPGIEFFLIDTAIVTGPTVPTSLYTLSRTPNNTGGPITDSVSVTAATSPILIESYSFNTPLGVTSIAGGTWQIEYWANVDSLTGVSQVLTNVCRAITGTGTVTITGSGTTRTATVSGSTPFVSGDANANISLCTYLQVSGGIFPITAFTSSSVVTITVPAGYVNQSSVAFTYHKILFGTSSGTLSVIGVTHYVTTLAEPAFTVGATDTLSTFFFGTTTSGGARTISYVHSSTTQYTHFSTPLITKHNDLDGLQGGAANEYYHLTSAQNTDVANSTSSNTASTIAKRDASGLIKANIQSDINAQTGTTYTLLAADNGKHVTLSNGSAITLTVPSGLGAGFSCLISQIGAGQVTITASGTTVNNRNSHTKLAGQYAQASLTAHATNVFILQGDTST